MKYFLGVGIFLLALPVVALGFTLRLLGMFYGLGHNLAEMFSEWMGDE